MLFQVFTRRFPAGPYPVLSACSSFRPIAAKDHRRPMKTHCAQFQSTSLHNSHRWASKSLSPRLATIASARLQAL
jgi:hypothetical protein